jgi:hypothetical protein
VASPSHVCSLRCSACRVHQADGAPTGAAKGDGEKGGNNKNQIVLNYLMSSLSKEIFSQVTSSADTTDTAWATIEGIFTSQYRATGHQHSDGPSHDMQRGVHRDGALHENEGPCR